MNVGDHVLAYIENEPFVLCKPTLAADLARDGWEKLTNETGVNSNQYCIAACVSTLVPARLNLIDLTGSETDRICIEKPDFERLHHFYEEHGLDPLTTDELETNHVRDKLRGALTLLDLVEPIYNSIRKLVKTIQVLRQDDAEIDTSYSHPAIPFSIFVSVCEDDSLLSSLRVAESILHESMHLQLTLIERVIDLIRPDVENYYFSPWREENRPARGVLHGIFVFRAVHDFYVAFAKGWNYPDEVKEYLIHRIKAIEDELDSLHYFEDIPDLTLKGKLLCVKLLEYYVFECSQ